jgi:hypothetical protein
MADISQVVEQKPAFQESKKEVAKLLKVSDKLEIADKDGMLKANDLLVDVKRVSKVVKAEKEKILKPMRESEKAVRAMFKPVEDDLTKITNVLTAGILDVKRRLDEAARKEEERILADKRIKRPETQMGKLAEIDMPDNKLYGSNGSSQFSEVKNIKVADLKQIPLEYFERPNVMTALLIELRKDWFGNKAQGIEGKVIPGVEEYTEQRLSSSV